MGNKSEWSLADMIVPLLALGLSFYYLKTVRGLTWMAQMYGGFLSYATIALTVVVVVVAYLNGAFKSLPALNKETLETKTSRMYIRMLVLAAATFAFISILPKAGYIISSTVFISVVMVYLGIRKPVSVVVVSVLVTALGYGLFIVFLKVPLPLFIR